MTGIVFSLAKTSGLQPNVGCINSPVSGLLSAMVIFMAQRLDGTYFTDYFDFVKNTDLCHKPLHMGSTTESQTFPQNPDCVCKNFSRYTDKDCIKDVTFIRSIPVLHAESSAHIFLRSLVPPERSLDT